MPSKYSSVQRKEYVRPYDIHPAWRGIGFLMIVITPIMAWAGAMALTEFGHAQGWPIMSALGTNLVLPPEAYSTPGLSTIANALSSIPNLPSILLFFVLFLIALSGILSFVYAIIYRMVGPAQYSPVDEPAPKIRAKKYVR